MKKALVSILVAAAIPLALSAETWKDVAVVDVMCAEKDAVKADPDAHPAKCAIACQKSGFGIRAADGTFLKFDKSGNEQALAAIKATSKTDHLRATVEGERKGNEIQVKSVVLN